MPGIRTRVEPESAFDLSVADEAYQLELHLQRKFEEDVARIFDESIYSDFELVCGRSKILTHTCILKARTKRFYQKLENILNFNINRNTYDEIYSFISDAYTECNINNQEKEILAYIDNNLSTLITNPIIKDYTAQTQSLPPLGTKEDLDESDIFLTPKCTTPFIEKRQVKSLSSSPSIELTKEYYALVPIDSSLLDRELKEQDVLSNAFQSIIKTQVEDTNKEKIILRNKPTSLSLRSSHASKTGIHSNNCDKPTRFNAKETITAHIIKSPEKKICIPSQTKQNIQTLELQNNIKEDCKKTNDPVNEKLTEIAYSPDSLITDDPSSSSDYLSAAYNFSPGVSTSGGISQLNVAKHINKMDNVFTSSDSGLENTLLESLNGQKDVTLTDTSLTESTLHDLITDDASHSSSPLPENNHLQRFKYENSSQTASASGCSDKDYSPQRKKKSFKGGSGCKSSKAEKQRQNEEIVILESSSLSSETGSWESVFPPKLEEKDVCTAFLNNERINSNGDTKQIKLENKSVISTYEDDKCPSLVQRSPFKSTSCFIDAASLVDDDETIKIQSEAVDSQQQNEMKGDILPTPSQPVPCSTAKSDISPNDWSEIHDNDDSLEQLDIKDPDSLQKDLSPTIFEMTPITEDSLCTNAFENAANGEQPPIESNESLHEQYEKDDNYLSRTGIISNTPNNSIMSLRASKLKRNDSEDGDSDTTVVSQEAPSSFRKFKNYIDYSPIVSGGASIEDHLPQLSSHVGSPLARRKIENIPIVSGAYIPEEEVNKKIRKSPKPTNAAAWVVDMSENFDMDKNVSAEYKKPGDRTYVTLKNESKIGSSMSKNFNMDKNVSAEYKKPEDRTYVILKNESKIGSSLDINSKSRSSVDSDSSEKSSHQFYIDLRSLPDPLPPKNEINSNSVNEKKNMFSMYIDLGEKSTLKEMPARLSSSLNMKKNTEPSKSSQPSECKTVNNAKSTKKLTSDSSDKIVSNECITARSNKKASSKLSDTPTKNSSIPTKNSSIEPGPFDSPPIVDKSNMSYFEQYEALCAIPDISVSDIIKLPEKSLKIKPTDAYNKLDLEMVKEEKTEQFNVATTEDCKNSNRVAAAAAAMDVFVRLSDLDKPKLHLESTDTIYEHAVTDIRMTRSIPDSNNWGEASHSGASRSIEVISSFHSENALSLNRLFPHLKNEFSRSMPGSLTSRTRSPMCAVSSNGGDMEEQASDMSEVSSVQSSICRSVVENSTTEDSQTSSLIGNCQSRLGQDLLRMFLEEIAPDVIVEVNGRRFKAHKCILSSRCQYFAGILSGGWVESAGNVIGLPPFSYNVVHFALCHIYSGVSTIPDSISMVELATIADMLGLEGLKEAIMFTLKVKYCHHFHKPCHVCTAGVLECFPLSSVYGLDDLYHKCLRWITKYFHKVWPTKAFATLPKELLDKCYQQHIVNMTTDNVVDTVCGCGMAAAALQSARWADPVERMCRRLMNAAAHFVASRLMAIIRIIATMPVEIPPPAVQALDDCLIAAIEWAPPDEACRVYAFLSHIVKEIRSQPNPKPDVVTNGDLRGKGTLLWMHANEWRLRCESSIVRSAPRAIDTQAFKDLPQDLRKRLRELGCIIYGTRSMSSTSAIQDKKTKSTQIANKPSRPHNSTRSLDMEHVRASFVPYSPKPTLGSTDNRLNNSQRIKKIPSINPPKIRTTKAQEERARFNLSQTNQSRDRNKNPSTGRSHHRFENTKPRYLEPRPNKVETEKKSAVNRLTVKMVSSSESSRNSSPVLARNLRTSRVKARQPPELGSHAMSQDSLATTSRPRTAEPSTDSLSESQTSNKYATYTKVKHSKGSVESVKSYNRPSVAVQPMRASMRTKIPVFLNTAKTESSQKRTVNGRAPAVAASTKPATDRKISGSLMMATKSSSAKMVPKINKEQPSRPSPKQQKGSKTCNKQQQESAPEHNPLDIPVMGRSGTFLKDEPTFGDKTTNIDIEQ